MIYITCFGKTDDGGARFHALLSVYVFYLEYREKLNLKFVYIPFHYELYNIKYKRRELYIEKMKEWDNYINFGKDELNIDEDEIKNIEYIGDKSYDFYAKCLNKDNDLKKFDNKLISMNHMHQYFDKKGFVDIYNKWIHKLLLKRNNINIGSLYFDNSRINVAIHIRRNDILNTKRYIEDEYYIEIIDKIKQLDYKNICKFYIYTQNSGFIEDEYIKRDCIIKKDINENKFITYSHLLNADILVLSISSFSYSAGLLNNRCKVIYKDFFHKKLKNWYTINDINQDFLNSFLIL